MELSNDPVDFSMIEHFQETLEISPVRFHSIIILLVMYLHFLTLIMMIYDHHLFGMKHFPRAPDLRKH